MLKGAWKITKESLEATSLKGVPRIFKAKRAPLKALWIICVLGFLCFVTLQVIATIDNYLDFKTVINNEDILPNNDDDFANQFPRVTFCNLKVVHHDTDNTSDFMTSVEYVNEMDRNITKWKASTVNIDSEQLNTLELLRLVPAYYGFIGRNNSIVAGIQFSEFMKQCFIDTDTTDFSIDCAMIGKFTQRSTPESFNCYSYDINSGSDVDFQPFKITFLLFLDSGDDYVSTEYKTKSRDLHSVGLQMALHSADEPFDFKRKSLLLAPGHLNAVNIDLSERHQLEFPYGVCTPNTPDAYYIQSGETVPYSRKSCHAACVQSNITEACACRDPAMLATATLAETELEFCASPRDTFSERVQRAQCALLKTAEVSTDCHKVCSDACIKLDVSPTLTSALWPRPSQQLGLYKTFIRGTRYQVKFKAYEDILQELEKTGNQKKALHALDKLSGIQNNFVLVQVIRSQVSVSKLADQIKTTSSDLVSTIGSLLNLYSGITVIIIVEILDFLYNMVAHFLCSRCKDDPEKAKKESRRSDVPLDSINGSISVGV